MFLESALNTQWLTHDQLYVPGHDLTLNPCSVAYDAFEVVPYWMSEEPEIYDVIINYDAVIRMWAIAVAKNLQLHLNSRAAAFPELAKFVDQLYRRSVKEPPELNIAIHKTTASETTSPHDLRIRLMDMPAPTYNVNSEHFWIFRRAVVCMRHGELEPPMLSILSKRHWFKTRESAEIRHWCKFKEGWDIIGIFYLDKQA